MKKKSVSLARPRIHPHMLILVLCDILSYALAYAFALWIRFDCTYSLIPGNYLAAYLKYLPIGMAVLVVVFLCFRMYHSIWKFAGYYEIRNAFFANLVTFAVNSLGITLLFTRMPISYYLFGITVQSVLTVGTRYAYRFAGLMKKRHENTRSRHRVMLIGAGEAGQMIVRQLISAGQTDDQPCCFIDDNPEKWGLFIDNVPVVGGLDDVFLNIEKYKIDRIYVTIPSLSVERKQEIVTVCSETRCEVKILPGIGEILKGTVNVDQLKDVSVEDLLGREPVETDLTEVFRSISGKVVLVTGGGGSIGSELCRQIAGHAPKQLIIFDIYENNAYDIQLELRRSHPELDVVTLIGSVRDFRRINSVFETYHPDLVYHAAAHKHVPLMEDSPCEAIKNNVLGTYKTAYAAASHGCRRFVMISTDKAVNPTNIMGASKRLCELVIQLFARKIQEGKADDLKPILLHELAADDEFQDLSGAKTEFVAVRFGNVLGSNGSVIPLFKKQIEEGGPVTVTHPDIIRYFMTIPEAVSLVLQAGTYARGGEIFVLDMGNPVKIDTLARNLIMLSGRKPDVDIKIEYIGLRPGEKLYEEKLMAEEGLQKTPNKTIHIAKPIDFDPDLLVSQLKELTVDAYLNRGDIRTFMEEIVPTYHPAENSVLS